MKNIALRATGYYKAIATVELKEGFDPLYLL
jgi:hypothetical protein